MTVDVLYILAGFALLTFAADRLVVSAARISSKLGLSTVLVGALVVGFGTSLPEMLVSGLAAARPGGLDFALGNIVGSNIANLALVLGVSAVISPIVRQTRLISREGSVMLLGSALLAYMVFDDELSRGEGVVLAVGLVLTLGLIARWANQDKGERIDPELEELGDIKVQTGRELGIAVVSLGLTLLGADLLVRGARSVAETIGVSDAVISLTLVAIGTSLPELATAIAAARRKHNDLVLGNVLGSNLFNSLGVGAVAAMVGPGMVTESFRGPIVLMMVVTALTGLLALSTKQLGRREGVILIASYVFLLIVL